ncbi:MAG TPA: PadR family transcriptional regulator [Candidatus Ozemobacteraceae bacterium]
MTDSSVLKDQKVRQFQKGILELAILKIISEKECYGYHIVEFLKQYRIAISEGTIYPLLSRLKDEEVITYRWEGSSMGPPAEVLPHHRQGTGTPGTADRGMALDHPRTRRHSKGMT